VLTKAQVKRRRKREREAAEAAAAAAARKPSVESVANAFLRNLGQQDDGEIEVPEWLRDPGPPAPLY